MTSTSAHWVEVSGRMPRRSASAGYFWPIWVILGWGIGVAFNAWDVYRRPFPTEGQIRHEMDDLREPHG